MSHLAQDPTLIDAEQQMKQWQLAPLRFLQPNWTAQVTPRAASERMKEERGRMEGVRVMCAPVGAAR